MSSDTAAEPPKTRRRRKKEPPVPRTDRVLSAKAATLLQTLQRILNVDAERVVRAAPRLFDVTTSYRPSPAPDKPICKISSRHAASMGEERVERYERKERDER